MTSIVDALQGSDPFPVNAKEQQAARTLLPAFITFMARVLWGSTKTSKHDH